MFFIHQECLSIVWTSVNERRERPRTKANSDQASPDIHGNVGALSISSDLKVVGSTVSKYASVFFLRTRFFPARAYFHVATHVPASKGLGC